MSDYPPASENASPSTLERYIRLSRTYTAASRRIDAKLSALHGLSFGDFMILHHLKHAHGGRLRRADLAECMGLTASAVTKSLLPLEKIGWISRQSDPRDARVGYACLTPSGAQLVDYATLTAENSCQEAYQAIFGELAAARSESSW
jgi:DNA-binding MarR family transcriptional regulator